MVHQVKYILFVIICLFSLTARAQIATLATTGIPAPQLSGSGAPSTLYSCSGSNPALAGVTYIQSDATTGRLWICDSSSGSMAWDHLFNAVQGISVSGTITGGSYVLGGCTSVATVTVTGATVGSNTASANAIFSTSPTGNIGLFNLTAWVSATNTVSVQGCAVGAVTVPNFQAKVLLY